MILVIDNYDSFTYNLFQYVAEILKERHRNERVAVFRNDKITVNEIEDLAPQRIIISPGPGRPHEAGISNEVVRRFAKRIPVLGVCLGHQCIAEVSGARIVRAEKKMHGKTSLIYHNGKNLFAGVENPFTATRYHSLIVDRSTINDQFEISAWTKEEEIMGVRIRDTKLEGVQFHPESILTSEGKTIIRNFLGS
jgi:para-aminobenzoate synthetase component 2